MITDNKPGSRQHRAGIERPKWVVACRPLRLPGTAVGQGKRGEGAKAGQERSGEVAAARSDHGEEGRRDMDKHKSTYETIGASVAGRSRGLPCGEEQHTAVGAVELEPEPAAIVLQVQGTSHRIWVTAQTLSQLISQAVFGGHEGFAVVVAGLFESAFYLLHAVTAVKLF